MKQKILVRLSGIYVALMAGLFIFYLIKGDTSRWSVALGGAAVSALPLMLLKLKNNPFNIPIIIGYYLLVLFSALLGSIASFYLRFSWWDSSLHFYKGILIGSIAIVLFKQMLSATAMTLASRWLLPLFILSMTVMASVFWEIYEFIGDQTFTHTMQRGGNTDTMIDLMCGTAGGLVMGIYSFIKKAV